MSIWEWVRVFMVVIGVPISALGWALFWIAVDEAEHDLRQKVGCK